MSFHQQGWNSRFASMGDESEAVFEDAFPKCHRMGLNRPEFQVSKLPLQMRYTPDYLDVLSLVECMGLGADQTLKLKVEKIQAMCMWAATHPVDLFVFDKKNDRWCRAPIGEWMPVLFEQGEHGVFKEGKPYVALKTRHMPFVWTKLADGASNPELGSSLPSTSRPVAAAEDPNAPQRRRHRPTTAQREFG